MFVYIYNSAFKAVPLLFDLVFANLRVGTHICAITVKKNTIMLTNQRCSQAAAMINQELRIKVSPALYSYILSMVLPLTYSSEIDANTTLHQTVKLNTRGHVCSESN